MDKQIELLTEIRDAIRELKEELSKRAQEQLVISRDHSTRWDKHEQDWNEVQRRYEEHYTIQKQQWSEFTKSDVAYRVLAWTALGVVIGVTLAITIIK